MSEHFGYSFDGDTFGKRGRGCKGMTGNMEGDILMDTTQVCNFLQVGVKLLIA